MLTKPTNQDGGCQFCCAPAFHSSLGISAGFDKSSHFLKDTEKQHKSLRSVRTSDTSMEPKTFSGGGIEREAIPQSRGHSSKGVIPSFAST